MRPIALALCLFLLPAPAAAQQTVNAVPVYGINAEPVYTMNPPAKEQRNTALPKKKAVGSLPKAAPSPVTVYGRPNCAMTQKYMKDLRQAGISYAFKNVDDLTVSSELFARMNKTKADANNLSLPIIEKDGKLLGKPDVSTLLEGENDKP